MKLNISVILLFMSFLMIGTGVKASTLQQYKDAVEANKSEKICLYGMSLYRQGEKEEKFINYFAQKCMRTNYIHFLAEIQNDLEKTPTARRNAVVFSSLVLQERLIIAFLEDNTDITTLYLPLTNHPISVVFAHIRDKKYHLNAKERSVVFDEKGMKYHIFLEHSRHIYLIIEVTDKNGHTTTYRCR